MAWDKCWQLFINMITRYWTNMQDMLSTCSSRLSLLPVLPGCSSISAINNDRNMSYCYVDSQSSTAVGSVAITSTTSTTSINGVKMLQKLGNSLKRRYFASSRHAILQLIMYISSKNINSTASSVHAYRCICHVSTLLSVLYACSMGIDLRSCHWIRLLLIQRLITLYQGNNFGKR
jgi:hypothetical protein